MDFEYIFVHIHFIIDFSLYRDYKKIKLKEEKEEEGRVLTYAYQQGRFTSNKKLGSCPIREKRKRMNIVKIFSG